DCYTPVIGFWEQWSRHETNERFAASTTHSALAFSLAPVWRACTVCRVRPRPARAGPRRNGANAVHVPIERSEWLLSGRDTHPRRDRGALWSDPDLRSIQSGHHL